MRYQLSSGLSYVLSGVKHVAGKVYETADPHLAAAVRAAGVFVVLADAPQAPVEPRLPQAGGRADMDTVRERVKALTTPPDEPPAAAPPGRPAGGQAAAGATSAAPAQKTPPRAAAGAVPRTISSKPAAAKGKSAAPKGP